MRVADAAARPPFGIAAADVPASAAAEEEGAEEYAAAHERALAAVADVDADDDDAWAHAWLLHHPWGADPTAFAAAAAAMAARESVEAVVPIVLGACFAAPHDAGGGRGVYLPLREAPLAEMLRDAAAAVSGATRCVTTKADSRALEVRDAMASHTPAQAAGARLGRVSQRERFVLKASAVPLRGDDAKARMRNLRFAAAAAGEAPRLTELEVYRVFDIGACEYFHAQTRWATAGRLIFVRQGGHGALSLVLVCGRRTGGGDAEEFTVLVRATA